MNRQHLPHTFPIFIVCFIEVFGNLFVNSPSSHIVMKYIHDGNVSQSKTLSTINNMVGLYIYIYPVYM